MGVPYAEVIGDPIAHSKSPLIHKFWLDKLGLEGHYRATLVAPKELHEYLHRRRRDPSWRGCNVTAPLKRSIVPYTSRIDSNAEKTGAVNTVIPVEGGSRRGFNTDVMAVARLLPPAQHRRYPTHVAIYVQIIGAGGAALAAVIGAVQAGYVDFDFFNRTIEKARGMAVWLSLNPDVYVASLEGLGPIRNPHDGPEDQRYSHVVVNATPMGRDGYPDVPIDLAHYYPDTFVLDMAYGKRPTRLVGQAEELGMRFADGLQMLVEQADESFRLFFRTSPPREHDAELRDILSR
ncbi:MAG TPA: shikimate dehydrogenase [Allosphingosinicella sp.]|nr:shikimate dehydrogenase [Allosphingosinicella sp.]